MAPRSPKYIEKWVNYLNSTDREMSCIAAQKLGETKDTSVVPELTKSLQNRPDEVRLAAVRALGEIGAPAAVNFLIDILHDQDPIIASAAADSLGAIGSEIAVPPLIQILSDYKNKSHHFQVHGFNRGLFMSAIRALQRIGTPEARRAVVKYHR